MLDCMKRRLLYAASQAYHPRMLVTGRSVGWLEPPFVVRREHPIGHRAIDQALVGRVGEGVVVAFRGSLPPFFGGAQDGWDVVLDWLNDALSVCVEAPEYGGGVHLGFLDSMRRLWRDEDGAPGVRTAIQAMLDQSLLDRKAARRLFVTGHSKGGALANLCAVRAVRESGWRDVPVRVATMGAARTGNGRFARAYEASRIVCLRYELAGDPVPHLPLAADAPAWVRSFARAVWPGLANADYRPVGVLVRPRAGPGGHRAWRGSRRPLARLLDRRGRGLEALTPGLLAAHAICPGSGYDRLICAGEEACGHGAPEGLKLRA